MSICKWDTVGEEMKNLNNKVAVVTGAGSGIGRELAIELAKKGCCLAITDVNEKGLADTVSMLGLSDDKVKSYIVDSSSKEATFELAEKVIKIFGQVDIVINNAGIASHGTVEELSYDVFEKVINVDMWGVIHGCKAFIPYLKQCSEAALVNVSSTFAFIPFPENAPYNMSKYAVHGLNETLMLELGDTSVNVLSVHPGGIKTNIANKAIGMDEEAKKKFNKLLLTTANSAAKQIVRAVERKKSYLFIGADAKLAHFIKRLSPKMALYIAKRQAEIVNRK